ncbi:MAG: tRNA preQ1(34) S-adenosylmethionine ribosyltransferase-isomerase QueA [Verrucomicrobia bacterium]|nr:MAG: tRNA preQ1(34) S-adenosylmethionine ribosyltransferase-isomerase QueA [Verrucomicrobiota bacterium]
MSCFLSDYQYELPSELIASHPLASREDSRLLVLHRDTGQIEHRLFRDLSDYITSEDLLILNNSKVIPARLYDLSRNIEVLLIEKKDENHWVAMVKPGRKMRLGYQATFGDCETRVVEIFPDGTRLLSFNHPPDLERWGEMPIPPYLKRLVTADDKIRYQTVFAKEPGSVAAPTAGLHFTKEILDQFQHLFITLHVGPGTFLPVKDNNLADHQMHREHYEIKDYVADRLNQYLESKRGRLVAVGTTTTRVLESLPAGRIVPEKNATSIFIRPPYEFQRVDALLTNFHLPASTLLMLISALAGREKILETYRTAVKEKYRFFSYGDCMLIL